MLIRGACAADQCSGINNECLAAESRLSHEAKKLVRVCKPLPDGAYCGKRKFDPLARGTCLKGVCIGKPHHPFPLKTERIPVHCGWSALTTLTLSYSDKARLLRFTTSLVFIRLFTHRLAACL